MAIYGTNQKDTIDAADGVTGKQDTIFGLDGNDTIYGLGGDDIMKGGGGADTFFGGTGSDWVFYRDSDGPVVIDLLNGKGSGGTADGDTYDSVENVSGSHSNDAIWGNDLPNTLYGLDGADELWGRGGSDVISGGASWDEVYGDGGADILYGGDGDDIIGGGAEGDQLFGGPGSDTAYYLDSFDAVRVSLMAGVTPHGGEAEGDTLDSIENLLGSLYHDVLLGDDNANLLWGGHGDDVLGGLGGSDTLQGSYEYDLLVGGAGTDTLTGGEDGDVFMWVSTDETGTTTATADRVTDFNVNDFDRIDLYWVDANVTVAGNQAFTFIGNAAFSGAPGELRYYQEGGNTYLAMQTGISGDPEGVICLEGMLTPQESWFVL